MADQTNYFKHQFSGLGSYVAKAAGEVKGYLTNLKKTANKVMDKKNFRKLEGR